MATTPQPPTGPIPPEAPPPSNVPTEPPKAKAPVEPAALHEVTFVAYPKLLFTWPLILAGFLFWFIGEPVTPSAATAPPTAGAAQVQAQQTGESPSPVTSRPVVSKRLGWLGWIYLWIAIIVLLTLGVDVDRNTAAFWILLVVAIWVLGLWLRDVKGFTLFGDIYRWFAGLGVQYDRALGLALSIILLVPYIIMMGWGRLNDRWRITHNEFEHFSFGKLDDSLGRGAKTVRTFYPDVFELLLGLAGTLVVYNASGTRELRRIPNVLFLPFIRKRLDLILARTAITTATTEEEEEEETTM